MTEREKFIRTFSHLHASDETLTEVLNMAKQENPRRHTAAFSRRAVTLVLAAALLLALGVTAYAVGLSIHAKRQEELREEYQVKENHVNAYREYETPEEAQPGVTLLAAYNGGRGVRVYVNISPVSPEEVRSPFYQTPAGEGQIYYLSYLAEVEEDPGNIQMALPRVGRDWDYLPEEQEVVTDESSGNSYTLITEEGNNRRYLAQAYDAETHTLTLQFNVCLDALPEGAESFTVHLRSYDNYASVDEESLLARMDEETVHRDFGSVTVPIPEPDIVEFSIPEPIRFTNPYDNCEMQLLGGRFTAMGFGWILHFDEMQNVLGKLDHSDETAFRAAFERQLSWLNFMDECTADACLVFSDGSTFPFAGSVSYEWLDDERILIHGGSWGGTIDVHDVVAVQVAGQTIEIPQMEAAPLGG